MNITSGITAQTSDGVFRKVSTSLDWNDFLKLVEEKKVPGFRLGTLPSLVDGQPDRIAVLSEETGEEIGVPVAWDWIRRWVDRLVIVHMATEGLITPEDARSQIEELFPRVSD